MTNDQQPQDEPSQQSPYPHFPVSQEGLKRLHQEYGCLLHMQIEQSTALGEQIERLTREQQALHAATRAFTARHADGKCIPVIGGKADAESCEEGVG